MPIAPSTPYDTAEYVLNLARAISSDAGTANGLAGDILADSQPYVFPILTKIYRDLQDELISGSSEIMSKYGYLLGLEPTAFENPRIEVRRDLPRIHLRTPAGKRKREHHPPAGHD